MSIRHGPLPYGYPRKYPFNWRDQLLTRVERFLNEATSRSNQSSPRSSGELDRSNEWDDLELDEWLDATVIDKQLKP